MSHEALSPLKSGSVGDFLNTCLNDIPPDTASKIRSKHPSERLSNRDKQVLIIEALVSIAERCNWQLIHYDGGYRVYTGSHYSLIESNLLNNFLCDVARRMGFDEETIRHYTFREGLVKQFHASGFKVLNQLEHEVVKINLLNGTLHITGDGYKLLPHNPKDYLLYTLNVMYDPEATCPLYDVYRARVLPDLCKQEVLDEFIGYSFCPNGILKLEKCLVLFGSGANGKSVFFDVNNGLLGSFNVSNYSLQSLTDKSGYYRASIAGKRLNYVSELSSRMDTSIFKMMVSGEPVEARHAYGRPFMVQDLPKFIFNTNELPSSIEHNDGFFRRFMIVHFDQTIPESERDYSLASKIIAEELPGVLNLVLKGLDRILANRGFSHCDYLNNTLNEFRRQHDPVRMFLDDIKAIPKPITVSSVALKKLFLDFTDYGRQFGYKTISLHEFSKRIREIGYDVIRRSEGRYVGMYIPGTHIVQDSLFN
jgi:putative DNA primase/helicase